MQLQWLPTDDTEQSAGHCTELAGTGGGSLMGLRPGKVAQGAASGPHNNLGGCKTLYFGWYQRYQKSLRYKTRKARWALSEDLSSNEALLLRVGQC